MRSIWPVGADLFDDRDPSGISDAQALALQVVDAFVWQPMEWPPGLGAQVVDALGPSAATELTLDLVRNAANKIAVAFDADEPQVETGVEYYDIDVSTGELRYDVSPLTPRALNRRLALSGVLDAPSMTLRRLEARSTSAMGNEFDGTTFPSVRR